MRFGLFFELSVPRPLSRAHEQQVYDNALEQAVLADELGFDHIWAVEHHFLEAYSHCSAPEVFLTAVAARTERIRIGHGAVVCVPEMNHPVRVAERAAALDIVSHGRLDLGTARSSTWTELGGFSADPDMTKKNWDEYVRVIPRMWMEEAFAYEGLGWSMPERNVLPKPAQVPHPPLWVTVTTPGTELDAADRGLGCLGVAAVSFDEQERRTAEYHRRIQGCDPVGAVVTDLVTTQNFLYCHEDLDRAAAVGGAMAGAFYLENSHLLWTREAYPTSAYQSLGNQATKQMKEAGAPGDARALPEGIAIGDPDRLIGELPAVESVGIDGVNFIANTCELIPQRDVLDSLRLFASEVMPKLPGRLMLVLTGSRLTEPATEPVAFADVEVLQAAFEVAGARGVTLLPPGLAPTIPTLLTFVVARVPGGAFGPFTMAEARVSCRSGVRARALVVASTVDGPAEVADALAAGWGFGPAAGSASLRRRYDRVEAEVTAWGLAVHVADPAPIAAHDIQYVVGLHPVVTAAGEPRLAQVELDLVSQRAERGRPVLRSFDGLPCDDERATAVAAVHPVAATLAVGTLTLPRLRFLLRPDVAPHLGTEVLAARS